MIKLEYDIVSETSAPNGRSTIDIKCPFCGTITTAYLRSMAGCGKKCDGCTARHEYRGRYSHKENAGVEHSRKQRGNK